MERLFRYACASVRNACSTVRAGDSIQCTGASIFFRGRPEL